MASRATAIINLMNHSRYGALSQLLVIDAVAAALPQETRSYGETNVDFIKRLMAARRGVVETAVEARAQDITSAGEAAVIEACKRAWINGEAWYAVASEMEDACGEADEDRFLIVEKHGSPDQVTVGIYYDHLVAKATMNTTYSPERQNELNVRLVCEDGDGYWHLDF